MFENKSQIIILAICVFLYYTLPFVALIIIFLVLLGKYRESASNNVRLLTIVSILCCIFVSAVNATKVPENDLYYYLINYHNATKMDLISYLPDASKTIVWDNDTSWKEPGYGLLVWLMNRFLSGNELWFKFFFSLLEYGFLSAALIVIAKKKSEYLFGHILCGIYLVCFIPYIFTMSFVILRQFLAACIILYLLLYKCFNGKTLWWLLIWTCFIHSTSFLFVPFIVMAAYDLPISQNKKWYYPLFVGLLGIQLISGFLISSGILSADSSLGYAASRAAVDTSYDLGEVSISKIIMCLFVVISGIYIGYLNKIKNEVGYKRFANVAILLGSIVLLNLNQSELSNRFAFYVFQLLPIIIVMISHLRHLNILFLASFTLLMMGLFSVYPVIGTWTYNFGAETCLTPLYELMSEP